jgi:hypothetical protein
LWIVKCSEFFLLPKYIKLIFRCVFLQAFTFANVGLYKVNVLERWIWRKADRGKMKLEIFMFIILKISLHFIISEMSESFIRAHKILQNIVATFQSVQNVNGMIWSYHHVNVAFSDCNCCLGHFLRNHKVLYILNWKWTELLLWVTKRPIAGLNT